MRTYFRMQRKKFFRERERDEREDNKQGGQEGEMDAKNLLAFPREK